MMKNQERKIIRDTQTLKSHNKSRTKKNPLKSREDRIIYRDNEATAQ